MVDFRAWITPPPSLKNSCVRQWTQFKQLNGKRHQNEEQDPKRKIDAVLSLVRSRMDSDKYENQQQLKFRKIVKNFCSFVGKKWMMGHRNEKFFSKSKDAWLSVE
ncbi:hypothetical protein TNCV_51471 [Trichonephila clavipes]|nr:hypothetical protein TNCV_51471 [Trichonephila clavipes]